MVMPQGYPSAAAGRTRSRSGKGHVGFSVRWTLLAKTADWQKEFSSRGCYGTPLLFLGGKSLDRIIRD